MERKLATIAKIEDIRPHPNADVLELAIIRGWQVVVKIGEFQPGDLCVYCEIDSLMPERPEFEFLAKYKYRIKTTKLRGQISQGIAFPISIIPSKWLLYTDKEPEYIDYDEVRPAIKIEEGADVTDVLGIIKYDPPLPANLGGVALGKFFTHSIKTDEERIQNLTEIYDEYNKYV